MASIFQPGDLVVSVYGDGDGSGNYSDNQASPITIEDVTVSGTVTGSFVLPQQTSTNSAGTTEYAISGEYGSSSEGSLTLSSDGQSVVIAGYGVNAATFNQGGAGVYGDARLAQSTSVQGGQYTAVQRVIADVRADGTVDTSTALYNVDNTNNPRSVATVDGTSFYLSGQGKKGDTTQGVFYVKDGATSAASIDTTTDTRTLEIYDGSLYVSRDSTQGTGGTDNIATYGGEPTGPTTAQILPGISKSVTLTSGNGNAINGSSGAVNLSPENFFFANATTLYVADGGHPKQGGVGDGGLQKWSLVNNAWQLNYTLSSGLNLVNATSAAAGTTGLIGLTGKVNGDGSVSLYTTNSTVGDTDQTYLYGITDTLANTAAPAGESFVKLLTAAADTNIRGVAFAPTASTVCFCTGTLIRTDRGDVAVEYLAAGDLVVTASGELRPVCWIGHRTVDCRRHPRPAEAQPVRISAHAFAESRPARDLVVSPGHALCLDVLGEVLVPASALVNGSTVQRLDVNEVTYWHVELDSHDILLAENMPAESYLDMGNRAFFAGGAVVALDASPDADPSARSHADFCRPFHDGGPLVEAVRSQMRRRAESLGWSLVRGTELHALADGRRLEPVVRGLVARFQVPAGTVDLRLVSPTARPVDTTGEPDGRALGLCLGGLQVADGFGPGRAIALDDPRLSDGFHHCEDGVRRWTAGEAALPAELWAESQDGFFLTVTMARPQLPRWMAVGTGSETAPVATGAAA